MVADSPANSAMACSAAGSVSRCPEPAIQWASSSAMQVRRGGKTAWYSRCPQLCSRTSARNAWVVSSEIAMWSGWPYAPSAPKVMTVSGSNRRMMSAIAGPSEDRWCSRLPSG